MRLMVTGVSGFIGGELAAWLVTEGHDVRGFSRDPDQVDLGLPVVRGDAATSEGLADAPSGIDVGRLVYLCVNHPPTGTPLSAHLTSRTYTTRSPS